MPSPITPRDLVDEVANDFHGALQISGVGSPSGQLKVFDFSQQGDMILESSDGVRFRVLSSVMSQASEVFAGMESLPQPATSVSTPAESKFIQLQEDSTTLQLLLNWIYATEDRPRLQTFEEISRLLLAARKYEVAPSVVRAALVSPTILNTKVVSVLTFTLRYNLVEEARCAARELVIQNINPGTLALSDDFKFISHWSIRRLEEICKDLKDRAEQMLIAELRPARFTCQKCFESKVPWVTGFLQQVKEHGPFSELIYRADVVELAICRYYWKQRHLPIDKDHYASCVASRLQSLKPKIMALLDELKWFSWD